MRYRLCDGVVDTVVDTDNATWWWREAWDERQRNHQTLYRSRRGQYYIEIVSQWQGSTPYAEWVSPWEATRWLARKGYKSSKDYAELPQDLAQLADDVKQ